MTVYQHFIIPFLFIISFSIAHQIRELLWMFNFQSFRFSNVCYWSYLSRTVLEIFLSIGLFLIYWCWGMPNLQRNIDCDVHGLKWVDSKVCYQASGKLILNNLGTAIYNFHQEPFDIGLLIMLFQTHVRPAKPPVLLLHFDSQLCSALCLHSLQPV